MILLAFVDLATRRLPNVLTGPAYGVTALFLLAAAADDWSRLGRALLGGAAVLGGSLATRKQQIAFGPFMITGRSW
ncbi:MAG TPA: hypothetical protein VGH27_03550 [Streptosporangiaceae bacterium]